MTHLSIHWFGCQEVSETISDNKQRELKKPEKPFRDFPLWPHLSGRWCRKHQGQFFYFGAWNDWQDALEKFKREWPYLSQGRTPPPVDAGEGSPLKLTCNSFLTSKQNKVDAGEITLRTFRDYYLVCERMVKFFGADRRIDDLRPDDFESYRSHLSQTMGPVTLKNEINRCRVIFNYALDSRRDAAIFFAACSST